MMTAVEPIRLSIESSASPGLAWTYLTDPERVAEWFADVSGVGEVGETYRIDFGDGSVVEGQIVEVVPGRRFSHHWQWQDEPAGPRTLVSWEVRANAGDPGSEIVLVHDGWTDADGGDALRDDHESYWSGYLDDLRDLLEDAGKATD
jgi:uncharacterized protein YndB with AHSA1/START domain